MINYTPPTYDQNSLPEWAYGILKFWFVQSTPADWFTTNLEFDQRIKDQFASVLTTKAQQNPEKAEAIPHASLAKVILFDQFSRNIYRGTDKAFAFDGFARKIAGAALEDNQDQTLSPPERAFLYMPFMHSEILEDQKRAVSLFGTLDNPQSQEYAQKHYDLIERFGRFPYRNEVLGRTSTEEELAYLKDGDRFGQ